MAICKISNKVVVNTIEMKNSILYLLTSLNTTGGTTAKIKSTLKYTKYTVYVGTCYNLENIEILNSWKQEKNVQIINTPPRRSIIKSILFLNRIIRKEKIGYVHSFFPNEMFITYFLKLLNPNLKIIHSFEGNIKRNFVIRFLSRMMLPSFDKVIFISKYVSDFYKNTTKRCKSKVIIDNAGYHICEYRIRNKSERCNIVSVAGLNLMKNVFMYPEIGLKLKEKGFLFSMKIIGDGPLRNELEKKILSYNIADCVKLEGKQIDPKPYYNEADMYIHPADKEGFGITVVEAMSAGLPVIVSDKGGVSELVDNMEDGLIVNAYSSEDWADSIIRLYNDRELYKKIAVNGHNTYMYRFTPEIYAKNLDSLYDSLLS
jgi:glycosyltransferase involved in cell wall biosynthesis